ncbi:hypothetical protein [Natronoglycomyces albus]|uniref:Uncharacterized protein n=1 Tax=Natronoglycomyces albus TaxID=2811108 RepID=A0A895XQQ8_9ACTN|nr:hypothetical protein [Natronoglycomyces albus]QSB05863.1 hypothetical protein JQS30_02750 [Natronoglycomyces albus]
MNHHEESDAVSASFASFRNDAETMFSTPGVDDLVAAAPARRRRRAIGLTVAITTGTAFTAAGMAVAQNLTGEAPPAATETTTHAPISAPASETEPKPASEHPTEVDTTTKDETEPELEPTFVLFDLPGDSAKCPAGTYPFAQHAEPPNEWELAQPDAPWELTGAFLTGDVNDDGRDDLVMTLHCEGRSAVAAFDRTETDTGVQLQQFAWVWMPQNDEEATFKLVDIDKGVIRIKHAGDHLEFAYDGEEFHLIEDEPDEEESPTPEPTESEHTGSESPGDTDEGDE